MALNGIDISGHNPAINAGTIPGDFVIVKATQGTGFVSPTFHAQINAAYNGGKLIGVYHYIDGSGGSARAEMEHYYNTIKPWVGKALITLDWESYQNSKWENMGYLEQCIVELKRLTGKDIVVYAGPYQTNVWQVAARHGCPKWVAQYPNYNPVYGYLSTPWNEGAYSCFIRQYTSSGRLEGYNGNLDLNKAYCTREKWLEYAGVKNAAPAPEKPKEKVYEVKPVINEGGTVYRYYNDKTGEHFYAMKGEGDTLKAPWKNEGKAFVAPKGGTVPVYRMISQNGMHLFTKDFNEASTLEKSGWKYEGVPFFGKSSGTAVYRAYNTKTGDHLLTASKTEYDKVVKNGYKGENVAFYV